MSRRQEAVRTAREEGLAGLNQGWQEGRQVRGQGEAREGGREERGLPSALTAPSAPPQLLETRPEAPPSYSEALYM